jgi:hypothetical protein
MVAVLTPPTSIAALKNGFRPRWHDSAGSWQGPWNFASASPFFG